MELHEKKNQIDNHIVAAKWNIFSRGFVLFLWLFHVVDVAAVVVVCTLAGWGSDCSLFIYSLSQAFIDAVHHFYYTVDGLIVDADVDIVDSHALTHSLSISISFSLPPPTPNQRSLLYPSYSLPVYYQNAMFFYKPESYCNYFIIFMHIRQFQPFPINKLACTRVLIFIALQPQPFPDILCTTSNLLLLL